MTPPGTPTEWRTLQKKTEANKPSENHPSTKCRVSKKAIKAERTKDVDDASKGGSANPNTQTKPEEAMTPPGTPTEWRALQKATEVNKPSANDTKPKRTNQQGGLCKCP